MQRDAAAARDAELEPILRETIELSGRAASEVIEQRLGIKVNDRTIRRARVRLGLG